MSTYLYKCYWIAFEQAKLINVDEVFGGATLFYRRLEYIQIGAAAGKAVSPPPPPPPLSVLCFQLLESAQKLFLNSFNIFVLCLGKIFFFQWRHKILSIMVWVYLIFSYNILCCVCYVNDFIFESNFISISLRHRPYALVIGDLISIEKLCIYCTYDRIWLMSQIESVCHYVISHIKSI